jgi:hypothetical protein
MGNKNAVSGSVCFLKFIFVFIPIFFFSLFLFLSIGPYFNQSFCDADIELMHQRSESPSGELRVFDLSV